MEPTATTKEWPPLSPHARRVLGVLIEKAKTTPDAYPLTLNGLLNGCNQKNNRDPLLQLADHEVEEAMAELKRLGYAQQVMGSGRADKFRHVCYEAWRVDKVDLAILGELLLRGPQTEGELRGRASRMEPIDDLEILRRHLKQLAERKLVVYLTPEGKRGTIVTHGFHDAQELSRLASMPSMPEAAGEQRSSSGLSERVARLEAEVAELREQIAAMRGNAGSA